MKRIILCFIMLCVIASSCSLFPNSQKIIEHDLSLPGWDKKFDQSWEKNFSQENLPEQWRTTEPPTYYIGKPNYSLSGLDPLYPFVEAVLSSWNPQVTFPAVYVRPCLTQDYMRYLFFLEGEYTLIDSAESLAEIYAPIQSSEEALSLAIAVTGFRPINELEKGVKYKIIDPPLDETFVQETEEGYIVHLFDTFMCGCGPHVTAWVNVLVRRDGSITEIERHDAFIDPEIQDVCFD